MNHVKTKDDLMLSLPSPERVLEPLRPNVDHARQQFLAELDTLTRPFNILAKDHYLERVAKTEGRPMLGEYVPWLVGDSLRSSSATIESTTVPWLLLYEHVLTTDDVIDSPSSYSPSQMILSSLLLERGLSKFRETFGDHHDFWSSFRRYYEETAVAELHETNVFHDPLREFTPEENLIMGRKSSIVKVCATDLSLKARGVGLSDTDEESFDNLCVGVQLFDDLTDWEEDLRARNFTYPLSQAHKWLADVRGVTASEIKDVTHDETFASLILSGAAIETVEESNRRLTQATNGLQVGRDAIVHRYVGSLTERNSLISREIQQIIMVAPPSSIDGVVKALQMRVSFTLPTDQTWHRLQSNFRILAQGSS